MRTLILCVVLLLTACCSKSNAPAANNPSPLMGLQDFEVMVFFSPYENWDKKMIYQTLADTFRTIGQVTISEGQSLFKALPYLHISQPICYFSVQKRRNQIDISLDVLAEVQVTANHFKMVCPVWKNKSHLTLSSENGPLDQEIANAIKVLVSDFSAAHSQTNLHSKTLSFHIQEFDEL